MDQEKIKYHITKILELIGEDVNRPALIDTPKRVAKMYQEIFRAYNTPPPILTLFPNHDDGVDYDQIITDQGYFFSQCCHHIIPFFGQFFFGYIPNQHIIGLSKVARVIDYFSAKLQIQEQLGEEIANYIEQIVKPKGIILQLKARHLCKEMRGVKKVNGQMTTSIVRGVFKEDFAAKEEFYNLIRE